MTTPAMNFVAVCANANIPLSGDKKLQLKHLRESGIPLPSSTTTADAKERFAMLAWIRHAIGNNIETSKWQSLLSTPLLTTLRTLYAIPASRADAPAGETDLDRLSRVVAVYMPAALPADSPTSSKPSNGASGINTDRDGNSSQPPAAAGAGGAAAPSSAAASPTPKQVIDLCGTKRKFLMHDDLFALLPGDVYAALDANGHLSPAQRQKMQ